MSSSGDYSTNLEGAKQRDQKQQNWPQTYRSKFNKPSLGDYSTEKILEGQSNKTDFYLTNQPGTQTYRPTRGLGMKSGTPI